MCLGAKVSSTGIKLLVYSCREVEKRHCYRSKLCSCADCCVALCLHNVSSGSWRKPNPKRKGVISPLCSSRSLIKIAPITYLFAHSTTMAHPSKWRTAAIAEERRDWDGYRASDLMPGIMAIRLVCAIPVPVSYLLRNVGGHWSSPDASTIGDGNRRASGGGSFACE